MNTQNFDYDVLIKNQEILLKEIYKLVEKNYLIEAENILKEYINLLSQENNLFKNLYQQELDESESEELEKLYEILTNKYIEVYSIKAVIHISQNKLEEAENFLKEGLKLNINDFDINYNLGYLYELKSDKENSIRFYKKSYELCDNKDLKENIKELLKNKGVDLDRKIIISTKYEDNHNEISNAKILHGTMEIANQMNTLVKGLKNMNLCAKSLNYYDSYLRYKSDFSINLGKYKDMNEANKDLKNMALKNIEEFDIFHFHFGTSLTLDHADLPVLKEFEKKVVMNHWGSDVRMYSKAKKLSKYVKVKVVDENSIKNKLEFLSQYIENCIVPDYELYEYVKEYYNNVHVIPVCIDLNNYNFFGVENNKKRKPLIVHAPTSPEIKGTMYILKAIEELKLKYDFEFKLVQGLSHEEAKRIYADADLIIDQILIGQYGLFAVETMAMGKPVIAYISDFMKQKHSNDLPIISANPDNIKDKIEMVIKDKEMMIELGSKGRNYVEKNHDMNRVSKKLLEVYKTI